MLVLLDEKVDLSSGNADNSVPMLPPYCCCVATGREKYTRAVLDNRQG